MGSNMSKRMWIMLVACVVVFGGIFGFKAFVSKMMNNFFDHMPMPPATISTAIAQQDSWAQTLSAVGNVKAVNGIAIASQASGVVTSIHFQSGDKVKQGALLLTLDDKEDRATLASLQAAAKLAQDNLERFQTLAKQGNVSQSQLDQAKSQRDQAVAQASAQQVRVGYKNITAPFSGELGIRQVDLGQYVSPGTALVTLETLSPIYVNFSLPEQDMPLVATGLKVEASLDSQPDKVFAGTINAVEPGVDDTTRNFNIQAKFENADSAMRPGMFTNITIQLPQASNVVVVPRTAISYNPYGDSVYVVQRTKDKDGKEQTTVISRFVKLGDAQGDVVAVLEGLKPGDEVATTGLLKLHNNTSVVIDNSVQPPAEKNPHPANS